MLVRFTKNGNPDTAFGDKGSVITQYNKYTYGKAAGLQHNGKIVVAATISRGDYSDYGIIRFNKDGSVDKSFGKDGWVRMDVGGGWDNVFTMAIQPDDKIVVAGKSIVDSGSYYSMVRFTADGDPDRSFGNKGIVMNRSANFFYRDCLALQPDGKIILASAVSIGDYYHPRYGLALFRYLNNGFPDRSFGDGGRMFVELGSGSLDEPMVAIALQKDGKIAASASVGNRDTSRFCVLRFNKDGTTDKMFGTNGRVETKVVTEKSRANNIFVQPDNKIIVVGTTEINYDDVFSIARYNNNGSLDKSFGNGGIVITSNIEDLKAFSVLLQKDNKILVGGYYENVDQEDQFLIIRYKNK